MSIGKTLSLGFLALAVLGATAQADPISSMTSSGQWTFWSQASNSTIGTPTYATASTPTPPPPITPPAPSIQSTTTSSTSSSSSGSASGGDRPDAYINFGTGSYTGSNLMTVGTIQPWYESPAVTQAFGGVPTAQQQTDFANTVLSRVEQTFRDSGVDVNLSLNPNSQAPHTLSVVSGASYGMNPNAIGISEVGGSGFSFIDKLNYTNSVDQLAWADARNIAHELMHAFGVATHHDESGKYLDAASATWEMLTGPNTTFSSEAAADIRANLEAKHSTSGTIGAETLGSDAASHLLSCHCKLCENGYVLSGALAMQVGVTPVPEPATMMLWTAGAIVSALTLHRRRKRAE